MRRSFLFTSLILLAIGILNLNINSQGSNPVPIIGNESPVFSLEAEVLELRDVGIAYILEYRGNPNYRISRFDSASGSLEEVFNMPLGGLVYGMALSADGQQLAISYTADFTTEGSGIYILDLGTDDSYLVELAPDIEGIYYLDLDWYSQDSLYATRSTLEPETNTIVRINTATSITEDLVDNAIDPAALDAGWLAYLPLETDGSRRSIGIFDTDAVSSRSVDVMGGSYDLDNLSFNSASGDILVSALESTQDTLSFGVSALAHGSHNIPSTWFMLDGDEYDNIRQSNLPAQLVYDAAVTNDDILLEVTSEGLQASSIDNDRQLLIKSRALRFIAI